MACYLLNEEVRDYGWSMLGVWSMSNFFLRISGSIELAAESTTNRYVNLSDDGVGDTL